MKLADRDNQVIWHPFTPQKDLQNILPIIRGEGASLIDEEGNRYIDSISSWWVNLHGHSHPFIAEKLYQQAKKLAHIIFADFTHEPAVCLAEQLIPLLPGQFSRIFYSDNGSTSTEVAIKMALQYWWNKGEVGEISREQGDGRNTKRKTIKPRNRILAFTDSYHGDTFGAMSISERSVFTKAFEDKLFEVVFINTPDTDEVYTLPSIDWDSFACFIYEPLVQGAGGMKMYKAAGLNQILQQCKEHSILCIADEVMTGFGRTGKLFASEYCETKPDIICLSKGLTGGTMALGVTACSQKIYEAFVSDDTLKTFFHGHSFTANPIACTAALASLELLQKEECKKSIQLIVEENKKFLQRLASVNTMNDSASVKSILKNIRQTGTIVAFEISIGTDEYLNSVSNSITKKALEKGIFLRPLGNTVYTMPPYCITKEELEKTYSTILEIIVNY